jgi:FkbM family methyltransferase
MIKKTIKRVLEKFGYQLSKSSNIAPRNLFTMDRALGRVSKLGLLINTVIDVGASDGRWSQNCLRFFPDASFLLVEAQSGHLEGLENIKNEHPKVDYVLAAAGGEDGVIFFDDSQLFGGQASSSKEGDHMKEIPQISLDNEVKRRGLSGPFLIKLDTHGYEIPILEGARKLLENTNLLIIETYNFKLTDNSLRYWEMCKYLDELGFAPIENVDLMLRKKDNSFWQMDTFFIPSDHALFSYNKYE